MWCNPAMLRKATRDDLPALEDLLRRANDSPYPAEVVAEEKCFGRGISGAPMTLIDDRHRGLVVVCGRYIRLLAVDRDHRREGLGSELLREAEGAGGRVICAEPGNYLTPGLSLADSGSLAFLHGHGYRQTADTWDLDVTLGSFVSPSHVSRVSDETRDEVLSFVEEEFGGIWRYEAALAADGPRASLFYVRSGTTVTGFAACDGNNRGLGSFGPTGVLESERGKGHGRALLHAALAELQTGGHEHAIIPWTDEFDFYRKSCGAVPAHQFVTMEKG